MRITLLIGLGSFIGGISRYLLSQSIQMRYLSFFPYGTMAFNLIGSFAIGIVFGLCEKGNLSNEWRLFLATGILGGFTTFSAFSNDSISMMRDGQPASAIIYIFCSVFFGLAATYGGLLLIR
jgi:CrcB protein